MSGTTHRKTLTHAEMDAIGQATDVVELPIAPAMPTNLNAKKVTPPTSRQTSQIAPAPDSDDEGPPEDREPVDIRQLEPLEIEKISNDKDDSHILLQVTDEDNDDDLEALLGTTVTVETTRKKKKSSAYCCESRRVGNVVIICRGSHERTGFGIIGPHWFGPPCVLVLLGWASEFFVTKAARIGPISTSICLLFLASTVYYLVDTAFRDPGIVAGQPPPQNVNLADYRWCDFCDVYQPPDGAHCPDCNVCIAGYDQ
jgi:hypothetical protein